MQFTCPICPFETPQLLLLSIHRRWHERNRIKKCVLNCGFASRYYKKYAEHLFLFHKFEHCIFCKANPDIKQKNFVYKNVYGLTRHLRHCPTWHLTHCGYISSTTLTSPEPEPNGSKQAS